MALDIDWDQLRRDRTRRRRARLRAVLALQGRRRRVVDDGRIIAGCNIENASYGISLCAECTLIGALRMTGGGRIVAVICVGNGEPVPPCGRCRQLLWEHGGPHCLVDGDGTPTTAARVAAVRVPRERDVRAAGSMSRRHEPRSINRPRSSPDGGGRSAG